MITSPHNPKIQRIRALLGRRAEREKEHAFVVEGVRLLEEVFTASWPVELVLFSDSISARGRELVSGFKARGAEVEEIPTPLMKSLADTETPQGVIAVVPEQTLPLPAKLDFLVIADQLRDPGNLGTLLRTAASAGAQGLVLTPGSVDPFSPKVLRSGMGAHFRMPIHTKTVEEIHRLTKQDTQPPLSLYLAEAEQGQPFWSVDLRKPCALVIGGEAEGAAQDTRQLVDGNIMIPMPGKTESLNAAVAAGILLFEVVRQRNS